VIALHIEAPARFGDCARNVDAVAGQGIEVGQRPLRAMQRGAPTLRITQRAFGRGRGAQAPCGRCGQQRQRQQHFTQTRPTPIVLHLTLRLRMRRQ
jgi:hypothetical protein